MMKFPLQLFYHDGLMTVGLDNGLSLQRQGCSKKEIYGVFVITSRLGQPDINGA